MRHTYGNLWLDDFSDSTSSGYRDAPGVVTEIRTWIFRLSGSQAHRLPVLRRVHALVRSISLTFGVVSYPESGCFGRLARASLVVFTTDSAAV